MLFQVNRLVILAVVSAGIFLSLSCSDIPDCTLDAEPSAVIVEFFNKEDSVLSSLTFSAIRALDTDSIFYQDSTLSTYDLQLNPNSGISTFLFFQDSDSDTLELHYARSIQIISEQCGPTIGFSDISVSSHTFDSVAVINNFLNRQLTENIEIYN